MKKIVFTIIAVLSWTAFPPYLGADTLRWAIPAGYRLEMVRTASCQFLINGKSMKLYEERNIIDLFCASGEQAMNRVKGLFSVYQRDKGEEVFTLVEQYPSDFSIASNGMFTVPDDAYMPNLRNIPSFPNGQVKPGDIWQGTGEMVIRGFSRPLKLVFPVKYRYRKDVPGTSTGLVDFEYEIDMDMRKGAYPPDFPISIMGSNSGTMAWDLERAIPLKGEEQYRIRLMVGEIESGVSILEYRVKFIVGCTLYPSVTDEEKERQKQELKTLIDQNSQIEVGTDDRGIVLRLGEVYFDFDSSSLKAEARRNLDAVAAAVRDKYRGREIIVEGHTDSTGGKDYNYGLSRNRARSVAEYLKPGIQSDKISFRGLGPDKPMADNSTSEGRQKNRRVEIIIKLN